MEKYSIRSNIVHKLDDNQPLLSERVTARLEAVNRNRVVKIVPQHRYNVRLTPSMLNRDGYINASLMEFSDVGQKYILTGIPSEDKVFAFWQMVLEQRSPTIIQFADNVEEKLEHYDKYFPDKGDVWSYGHLQVERKSYAIHQGNFHTRNFILRKGNETHRVLHFTVFGWTETTTPIMQDFLALRKVMKDTGALNMINPASALFRSTMRRYIHTPPSFAPIIQSARGSSRAGAFVVIDLLIRMIDGKKTNLYSVEDLIVKCKHMRIHCVPVALHHSFIYEAVLDYLLRRNPRFQDFKEPLIAYSESCFVKWSSMDKEIEKFINTKTWFLNESSRNKFLRSVMPPVV
ncbi:Protein sdf-9 [Caenorhabditis elegans]|uniref:Protein sdf-9 n=1 Tax=Caenorhabditis elegans TaxID=6239 RepID=EAK5_CAEEL|nr:Protein sdf-9 [Caenorhabditis elegans]G5EGA9.1 RecName: Full=Protein sdf-9; AltName: Full=Synthetic dauer formation 9 [Caenorhabditis elegans]BAC75705.1 SDF-9 protein [Caenorhabditis elegans]CAA19518.3 Protein sdf-9 [Caenorhabditis elegans]|eukprot:NP_508013.2 Protein sdf-9 [Caenorhabditis elegans]